MGKANANWAIRKIAYAIISLIMVGLVAFGVVSEATSEAITAQIAPLIGAVALAVASAKTNRGSDSSATGADVERAAQRTVPQVTPLEIADVLADRLGLGVDTGRHHITGDQPDEETPAVDGGYPPSEPGV